MNSGMQDRKKLYAAASLGLFAVGSLVYELAGSGSSSAPSAAAPATTITRATPTPSAAAATKVSHSTQDPTLHPEAMELTESLIYSGGGRNIFSLVPVTAPVKVQMPHPIAPARPITPQIVNSGPPPPPPIDLRFFGTATRPNGSRQAFFAKGDDVFIASPGDVVSRRYKVGAIQAGFAEITDLSTNATQRLPLQQ